MITGGSFHSDKAVRKQIVDHKPKSRGSSSEYTIEGKDLL